MQFDVTTLTPDGRGGEPLYTEGGHPIAEGHTLAQSLYLGSGLTRST